MPLIPENDGKGESSIEQRIKKEHVQRVSCERDRVNNSKATSVSWIFDMRFPNQGQSVLRNLSLARRMVANNETSKPRDKRCQDWNIHKPDCRPRKASHEGQRPPSVHVMFLKNLSETFKGSSVLHCFLSD